MIAIIPARSGSKRIKNKNIKYFFGKPIISHVIEKLKKSKLFSKIYISTDCNITENIAKKHKIDVLKRDKNLSDDMASLLSFDIEEKIDEALKTVKNTTQPENTDEHLEIPTFMRHEEPTYKNQTPASDSNKVY